MAKNKVVPSSREIIQDRVLMAANDKAKCVLILELPELQMLIKAMVDSMVYGPLQDNDKIHFCDSLLELRRSAFGV